MRRMLPPWRARPPWRRGLPIPLVGHSERVRVVNSENLEMAGEELELFQRQREVAIVRMAFDIGVELRREEVALDHVALELGHVDAVGGEATQRLVERGRDIAHLKHE